MCSVGDAFDIDVEGKLPVKHYVCKDCGNKFRDFLLFSGLQFFL